MPESDSFYMIRLTPPGAAAIATVRAEGTSALGAVAAEVRARSGKPLGCWPTDRPILALFGAEPGEPVVVHRRGDDAVELYCHGGPAAVARMERALAHAGAERVEWQEWVCRQAASPIAAEAQIALAHARTERTAAILLDQFGGALARALAEVERLLATGNRTAARERIQALLARAEVGRHLTEPWRVVLAGRPNVGKSSLMNAMLGYERAIVHPTAGTTRDLLAATTALDGWPVELTDTAGLLPKQPGCRPDAVLRGGTALARERLAAADLIVLVFDRAVAISAEEADWLRGWPGALPVDNKSDLPAASGPRPAAIATSALRSEGIAELLDHISARLVPEPPAPGAAVPFTEAQRARLRTMAERLDSGAR